ncbi:hypothetical protein LguiA_008136 [Lonicera macranthoides]
MPESMTIVITRRGAIGDALRLSRDTIELAIRAKVKELIYKEETATLVDMLAMAQVKGSEALAVLEGLRFVDSLGLQAIEINSDALRVVKMLLDKSPPRADSGVFILDALDFAKSFSKVSFAHVLRSANEAANSIEAFAVRTESLCTWGPNVPSWLQTFVMRDLI